MGQKWIFSSLERHTETRSKMQIQGSTPRPVVEKSFGTKTKNATSSANAFVTKILLV